MMNSQTFILYEEEFMLGSAVEEVKQVLYTLAEEKKLEIR